MKKKKEKRTTKLGLKKFTVAKLNNLNVIRGGVGNDTNHQQQKPPTVE